MNNLLKIAKNIGNAFKSSPYYDSAEKDMQLQWDGLIWPFIKKCNFANTIDLAAGHGRNAEMLKKISDKITLVDINKENIDYCKKRFQNDKNVNFLITDGVNLEDIPDDSVTFIYCWDAMVHFDSDIIRNYLKEFHRILTPEGRGFCHHSNFTENPDVDFRNNPHWRNYMSASLFKHYCHKEKLRIIKQKIMDWERAEIDCISLFEKPMT